MAQAFSPQQTRDSCPKEGRKRRLLNWDEVPMEFREVFIKTRYRPPDSDFNQCLCSAFQPSNETVNFWTHFVPLLLFMGHFYMKFGSMNISDPGCFPLISMALGTCGFCIMSSCAHLFNCMSSRIRHVCFYFDYAAINIYSVGTGLSYFFYCRPRDHFLFSSPEIFIGGSLAISLLTTYLCCSSRHRWLKLRFVIRTLSFTVNFFYNTSPYFARIYTCEPNVNCLEESNELFWQHCMCYLLAALFNMTKLPECLASSWFDFVGHSHHYLHVFTALGASRSIKAVEIDMILSKTLPSDGIEPTSMNSIAVMILAVVLNIGIVHMFAFKLKKDHKE